MSDVINDFINYIDRINAMLKIVNYDAVLFPATFAPCSAILIGPKAHLIAEHVITFGKVKNVRRVNKRGKSKRYFFVEFDD